MSVVPSYLSKGDTIAIVATAKKINPSEVEFAISTLKNWGFKVKLGEHLYNEHHQFAGTDEQRLNDFQNALDDPSIDAILCARGGYGTVRIIDNIEFSSFIKTPKWIIGFSDITVLHNHIHQNFGVATLHATMPINFSSNTETSLNSLHDALTGSLEKYHLSPSAYNRLGNGKGELVGGNLSIIYSLLGSRSDIDTTGKILLIEDLTEYLYHVDRIMIALKRTGKLKNLAGLMVGSFTKMQDNDIPFGKKLEEIIIDAVKIYDYPICFNVPIGHEDENWSLPLGTRVELKVHQINTELSFIN